jgi:vacuolar-type H+-ATPase subunit H
MAAKGEPEAPFLEKVAQHEQRLLADLKLAHEQAEAVLEEARAQARAIAEVGEEELRFLAAQARLQATEVANAEAEAYLAARRATMRETEHRAKANADSLLRDLVALVLPPSQEGDAP